MLLWLLIYEYSIGEKRKTHKKKIGTIKCFIVPEIWLFLVRCTSEAD